MGRSSASDGLNHHHSLHLDIKPPSLFRCPISLEVMRSPVSLVTGVTYDRRSIQRWLDSGNTTCPATMLPLPSTDLVPNLTLRRLITLWSSSSSVDNRPNDDEDSAIPNPTPEESPLARLVKLQGFFTDSEIDESIKNSVINAGDFISVVVSAIVDPDAGGETVAAAVEVVFVILDAVCIEQGNKEKLISALCSDLDAVVRALASVLRDGRNLDSRANCARILQAVLSESRTVLAQDISDTLILELISLVNCDSASAIEEGLGCLIELVQSKGALKTMVQSKSVLALVKILSSESVPVSTRASERALLMLEAAANSAAGRAAISEVVEECVEAVMGKMMKVGKGGREAAVGMLWDVCYSSSDHRRGREAVAAVSGGMSKILVVMQGDCSPAVRKMAGELLKVFRVNAKSLVAGYDTKTTHIMPF